MISFDELYYIPSDPRIIYQSFEMTIPAGEAVEVKASFEREEGTTDAGGTECGEYDVVTTLDSSLDFTKQTITLKNTEYITLVEEETGKPLDAKVEEITLGVQTEGYKVLLKK